MNAADLGARIAEFFAMGGHALYVWLSYGAALAVVLYNVISVRRRERRFRREHLDRARRHSAVDPGAANRADGSS